MGRLLMSLRLVRVLVLGALLGIPLIASAQRPFPPEKAENLKVLPKDIPIRALLDTMRSFTNALGVRCQYCHVGNEGEPLSSYNFASDDKDAKKKARVMLQMVAAINNEHLTKLTDRRTPPINVTCMTCHRGVAEPRPLQQVLMNAYDAGGADSAEKAYRALRTRYLGRAAYDFGEVTLADVGAAIRAKNNMQDALRFYRLNTEMVPTSAFAFSQAANAQLAAGDTVGAIASLEKAVAINPNDPRAKAQLDRLKKKP
jgi:tetratricopeptide (TPR) repeat protein